VTLQKKKRGGKNLFEGGGLLKGGEETENHAREKEETPGLDLQEGSGVGLLHISGRIYHDWANQQGFA